MHKRVPINALEKQGALQILIYLYEKSEKANISEIAANVISSRETILSTIVRLKLNGLVKESRDSKRFPYPHSVWLTPKGKEVAQHLLAVSNVLSSKREHPSSETS